MAVVLLLAFVLMGRSLPTVGRAPELVGSLVDKHLAYAQLEGPAEFPSTERTAVAAWFRQRTGLRVPVPDLSPDNPFASYVARLRDGEEAALEELVEHYAPVIRLEGDQPPAAAASDVLHALHAAVEG